MTRSDLPAIRRSLCLIPRVPITVGPDFARDVMRPLRIGTPLALGMMTNLVCLKVLCNNVDAVSTPGNFPGTQAHPSTVGQDRSV